MNPWIQNLNDSNWPPWPWQWSIVSLACGTLSSESDSQLFNFAFHTTTSTIWLVRVWSTWKGQVIPLWPPWSQTASFLILPGLTFHHLPSWVWLFITPSQSYLWWFIATGRTDNTFNWPVTLNVTALVVFNLDASDMAWHSTFDRSRITLLHELPWDLDLILSTSTLCRPSSAEVIKVQY